MLYALTVLVSSFLLLLVQPIIAKQILPWFGGSAAVWAACLMFFQGVLLAGYAYADLTSRLRPRTRSGLHVALLLASLAWLPIAAGAGWKPAGNEEPVWRVVGVLAGAVGLPYFMLCSTGPLVQSWFARERKDAHGARRAYRLFALSNFSSLLGLLSYPFAIEPWLGGRAQAIGWSIGYGAFVVLSIASALRARSVATGERQAQAARSDLAQVEAGFVEVRPGRGEYARWLAYPAVASLLLVAISNHISQNVAAIPFLWVMPLALYLLSFVFCFEGRDGRGWYVRGVWLLPVLAALCAMAWGLTAEGGLLHVRLAVPLYCAGLFLACMLCHGELAAAKPAPRYLTRYYLTLSLGSAIGSLSVSVVAPRLFTGYWELPLGLAACALLALLASRSMLRKSVAAVIPVAAVATSVSIAVFAWQYGSYLTKDTLAAKRNFYGTLRVVQKKPDDDPAALRALMNGAINHGEQHVAPAYRGIATTYYGAASGIGMLLTRLAPGSRRVGVIGLGVGTLLTYGEKGDYFRVYEINPQVIDVARSHFFFLEQCKAAVDTVLADARLALEREAPQRFDVLAVDAFSSDAIPAHLLTREALQVYLRHMKPDGAIAFHVSNRYLSLAPVVQRLADEAGLRAVNILSVPYAEHVQWANWVIVTADPGLAQVLEAAKNARKIGEVAGLRPWTDDYSSLLPILR